MAKRVSDKASSSLHRETVAEMTHITITEAAKSGWASRPTIYRKIKSGDLQTHEESGTKKLEVADLVRVFGEPSARSTPAAEVVERAKLEAELDQLRQDKLRIEADLAEARCTRDAERERAEKERDRLISLIEAHTRQIEDMRRPAGRSVWKRLFGKA